MMKKIISVMLVFTSLLSSFGAFAANYDAESIIEDIYRFDVGDFDGQNTENANLLDDEKIKFLDAIGVWDDADKSANSFLNMSEFLEIMSKVEFGYSPSNSQKEKSGNATYKDALQYLVRMVGYSHLYEQYGSTDTALIRVADEIKLISSAPESINAYITRGELAKLVSKAVVLDLCVVEYSGTGYEYVVNSNKNLLSDVHSIYDVSGFVNAIHGLNVYSGVTTQEGYIQIDRTNISTSGMELSKYYGTLVDAYAYYDESTEEYSICYIDFSKDCTPIEIDFKDITYSDDSKMRFVNADGKEKTISFNKIKTVVENGKRLASVSDMCDYNKNEGKIVFTKSSKKSEYDTAIIYKYNYYVVDYNDSILKMIGLKFNATHNGKNFIQFDDEGINNIKIDGNMATYSEISYNSAIRVFECAETGYMEIVASTGKVTGKVNSLYEEFIEVDGKGYRLSKNVLKGIKESSENEDMEYADKVILPCVNDNVTLHVVGNVVAGFIKTEDEYIFGFLKSVSETESTEQSLDYDLVLRVYSENSEWLDLSFADKVVLDGKRRVKKEEVIEFVENNRKKGYNIGEELIRFKLNNEGKISMLDTIYESEYEKETDEDLVYVGTVNPNIDWTYWTIEGSNYLFKATAPIFVIPNDIWRENDYKITRIGSVSSGSRYTFRCYNPDDFLHIGAMIFRGNLSSSDAMLWMHIEKISTILTDDDEVGYQIIGKQYTNLRSKGKGICREESFIVEESVYEEQLLEGNGLAVGDFIEITTEGKILKTWKMCLKGGDFSHLPDGITNYGNRKLCVGRIKKIDTNEILVLVDCGESGMKVVSPRAKGVIDLDRNITTNVEMGDFHEGDRVYIISNGAHADFIMKTVGGK